MLKQNSLKQQTGTKRTKTTSPLTTTKRTKTWKKHQKKVREGVPKGPQTTLPGQLTKVIWDRMTVRDHLTWNRIKPKVEFKVTPMKENGWAIEEVNPIPKDLHHRILSYVDQFETPIRPKQIVKHFTDHPTSPAQKDHVYTVMESLSKHHNIRKLRKIDEEGTEHWFYTTTPQSRIRHNNRLKVLIKTKRPLPLDEVVWETFENQQDSYANFREMNPEQRVIFEQQQKAQKDAQKASI